MTYVNTLSLIIAKVLTLVESLLDEWVDVNVVSWSTIPVDDCGPMFLVTANETTCGENLIEYVEDLVHGTIALLVTLLAGIGVMNAEPIA